MREEKRYLVEEVKGHLDKSDYLYLADYNRMTVTETAELRGNLAAKGAEFHVVKNTILRHAAEAKSLPDLGELGGQTAIIVGGDSPTEVAKIVIDFAKAKDEKCSVKKGVMGEKMLTAAQVVALSKLPSLEVIRAQLLGLMNTPAQQMVRVLVAVPEGMLNVLQAKAKLG